jgi:hypothetical protein
LTQKLPDWMTAHVQKCRAAFGIDHAGFLLYVHRLKDLSAGDALPAGKQVSGDSNTSAHYRSASVRFAKHLPEHMRYEVVTHELLHAAMGDIAEAADIIIAQFVPDAQRDQALAVWHLGQEQTVTQLARALTPLLCAMDVPK